MNAADPATAIVTRRSLRPGHALAAAAALAPPVAVLAPLGLAPVMAAAAVGVLILRLLRERAVPWRMKTLAVLFTLTVLLSLASALWSVNTSSTLGKIPQLAGTLACGYLLFDAVAALGAGDRALIGRALLAGLGAALCVLAVEWAFDFPLRRLITPRFVDRTSLLLPYKRGLTVLVLLMWPAALILWRQWRPGAALLFAAILAVLSAFDSGSARFAMLIGLAAAVAAAVAPRLSVRALAAVLIAYIATAPILHDRWLNPSAMGIVMPGPHDTVRPLLPRSGYHRLLIWQFASERIAERPVGGWGLDSSRHMPGGNDMLDWAEQAMPLHPHNAVLQIWLELGLGGALLLAVLAGWVCGRLQGIARRPDHVVATALTGATAAIACLSFGIWQSWWLAAIFLSAALYIAVAGPGRAQTPPAAR